MVKNTNQEIIEDFINDLDLMPLARLDIDDWITVAYRLLQEIEIHLVDEDEDEAYWIYALSLLSYTLKARESLLDLPEKWGDDG